MNKNDLPKIDPVIIENMEYPLPKQPNRFFQMLSNAGDKIGDVGSALKNRVSDIILGQEIEEPKTIITDEGIQSGINNGGRRGGLASFLGDVTQGTRENMANSFEPTNLLPNKNKGFGYRLGEALGTGARLLDNSLVRGALAYGLSKYNGDYNPLEQGLIALGTNMQNKTNDRLYRNDLALNGIDTSNIRGFIDNNTYSNLIRSQQIRDNAEWRKLQNETMQDMKNREFEYRKKQDAIENVLRARGIEIQEDKANANKTNDSDVVIKQLEELMNLHSKLPQYKSSKGFQKGSALLTGGLSDIGLRTDEIAAYEGVQNMMTNLIARKLAGEKGVMTDKDFDRAKKMLPNIYDSPQQARAKYNALLTLYYANPTNQPQTNTQGKYKEGQTATNPQTGQKMIFRGGQWQIL